MNIPIITDVFAFIMKMIMKMIEGANGVNFAVAILLFTLIVKLLLLPLQLKSKKGMLDQQRLAPKVAKLEKKYGNNKQKYQEEVSKLYKEEKVSLMGGCLPTIITLVIVLGLYTVIYRPVTHLMNIEKNDGSILAISQDLIELKEEGLYKVDGKALADCSTEEEKQEYLNSLSSLFEEGNTKGFMAVVESGSEKSINQVKIARLLYGNIEVLNEKLAAEQAEAEAAGTEYTAPYSTKDFFDINFGLFGLDLGEQPSYKPINILVILPILSGITSFLLSWVSQYYQKAMMPPKNSGQKKGSSGVSQPNSAEQTSKMMMYTMPIMSLIIGFMLPAGITVYWILNNVFSMAQEPLIMFIAKKRWFRPEELEALKKPEKSLNDAKLAQKAESVSEDPSEKAIESSEETSGEKAEDDKEEQE